MDAKTVYTHLGNYLHKKGRPAIVPEVSIDVLGENEIRMRRIDALVYESGMRTAFEIKVSKADARNESWKKVEPWRRVVHRFIYVVPAGLLDRAPVSGCGLWWVYEDGRVEVKGKATVQKYPEPLPENVVKRLMYKADKHSRYYDFD